MASSINLFLLLTFFTSLIFLSSQTTPNIHKISSNLLTTACNTGLKNWDSNLCLRILKSRPKIMSSTNQVSFALNIIESGIENATTIQTYINRRVSDTRISRDLKLALKVCVGCFQAWDWVL